MTQRKRNLPIARSVLGGLLPVLAGTASMPSMADTAAADAGSTGLAEIVVTAEKRGQNLQSLAASVAAFDNQAIKELHIEKIEDITQVVPGLVLSTAGPAGDPQLTLRGLGMNNGETNQNPAVTPYINEIALPSIAYLGFQIFDLDRIEVLEGPQGTLYGRNTTGGAINFITKRPTREFTADGRLDVGNFNSTEFEGAVGGGLSDTVAARIAVDDYHRDGYQHLHSPNGAVDPNYGDVGREGVRASVSWTPMDSFDLLTIVDYGRNHSQTLAYKTAGNLLTNGSRKPCSYPTTGIPSPGTCGTYSIPRTGPGGAVTGPVNIFSDQNSDPNDVYGSFYFGNRNDAETHGVTIIADKSFARARLTSVTGYRDVSRDVAGDDGVTSILSDVVRFQHLNVFSEEVRLASDASWQTLSWLFGAYYTHDKDKENTLFNQQDQYAYSALFDSHYLQTTWSAAAFAEGDLALTDKLKLTTGARFTHEDKEFDYGGTVTGSGAFPTPVKAYSDDISANEVTGKVGLEYQLTSDKLLYANVSKGFKGGGFPATIAFSKNNLHPFAAEKIRAYEVGFKSTLIPDVLRANVAAYFYDWKDFQATTQVNISGVPVVVLADAGDARVAGVEAEITWSVTPSLSLRTGGNWLDNKIKSGIYIGQHIPNAPQWMVNEIARFEPRLATRWRPFVQADANYSSPNQTALANTPAFEVPSLVLLNARVGVKLGEGAEFALWAKNLADREYLTQIIGPGSASLPARFSYGEPRMFGVSVSYNY
jgi:iron complex outermembrane receptor protein